MSDAREIHQIEYRWHERRDLSPVASSMSLELTRGWDSRIRGWVRHPNSDQPAESVRYQILPNEGAAIAWRYRDRQAAQMEDGTHGRPLVSRVLIGHAALLTPETAIALCRTGLPAMAGERAGQVEAGAELPPVSADELAAELRLVTSELDREAAFETGLSEVVAAALSDPDTPLAISIPDQLISRPPGEGVQSRLLWGLWRLAHPFLGPVRRNWSFSTFELPLGEVDPRALPDIIFRLAQPTQAAPATPRKELKVRPGIPALALDSAYTMLAEWLVAEYRHTGGSGLGQLIEKCCTEQTLSRRLTAAYQLLGDKWASAVAPVPPATPGPAEVPPSEAPGAAPEAPYADTSVAGEPEYQVADTLSDIPIADEPSVPAARSQDSSGDAGPRERHDQGLGDDALTGSLSSLLELLGKARDGSEVQSILGRILTLGTDPDAPDRRTARILMAENDFFLPVCTQLDFAMSVGDLAGIFCKIVIPELDRRTVRAEVADWAYRAEPLVIDALLVAARSSGGAAWDDMRTILQPELALRWLDDNHLSVGWERSPAAAPTPPPASSRGGLRSFFKHGS